jgi:hypothetical protein
MLKATTHTANSQCTESTRFNFGGNALMYRARIRFNFGGDVPW